MRCQAVLHGRAQECEMLQRCPTVCTPHHAQLIQLALLNLQAVCHALVLAHASSTCGSLWHSKFILPVLIMKLFIEIEAPKCLCIGASLRE